jgi:hypothetical protein
MKLRRESIKNDDFSGPGGELVSRYISVWQSIFELKNPDYRRSQ